MNPPQARQRLAVAEQVHDPGMILHRSRNDDEELSARSEARQTGLDVLADRLELQGRQESVIKRRLPERAQQRAPEVVRSEGMIGHWVVVIVPPAGQFSIECGHRFVSPRPMAQQACETIQGRISQRPFDCFASIDLRAHIVVRRDLQAAFVRAGVAAIAAGTAIWLRQGSPIEKKGTIVRAHQD